MPRREKSPAKLNTSEAKQIDAYLADPENKRASTIGKRTAFNPLYPNGHQQSILFLKGLHQAIESYMIDNPGKQIPKAELEKQFGCTNSAIDRIARKIEARHGLPKRQHGGANFVLPKEAYRIIDDFYSKTPKGGTIHAWDIIKKIAQETGYAATLTPVRSRITQLNSEKDKGIKITTAGKPDRLLRSANTAKTALQKEGIKVTKTRTRNAGSWQ